MLATHLDAERRYNEIRKTALRAISSQVPQGLSLGFKLIDESALTASKKWALSSGRAVDWDWVEGYGSFKFRYPKRFELALWHKDKLVSLSLGRPTYTGTSLRLDVIEGSPEEREIKVFPAVIAAMAVYATGLGASEIRVMNPINDSVKDYYANEGFKYVAKGNFLYKKLSGLTL
jgi:hypothetical protein